MTEADGMHEAGYVSSSRTMHPIPLPIQIFYTYLILIVLEVLTRSVSHVEVGLIENYISFRHFIEFV